jgi:hypothetical protein
VPDLGRGVRGEGKALKGFAFLGLFCSGEMASWQLALRWGGLLNVGQAASLPIRRTVLSRKPTARKSAQGAHRESGGQGHRRKERDSQSAGDALPRRGGESPFPRARETYTPIFHSTARVKGRFGQPDFSVVAPPFFTTQKNQKNREIAGICAKIVQRLRAGHLGK